MSRNSRRGVTLIELMVALAITLIMLGAVITLFANITGNIADSRAMIEISERLRSARNRLQKDLGSVTARLIPPANPGENAGYFEIIEGPTTDATSVTSTTVSNLDGDVDDKLMFTIHGRGESFLGTMGTGGAGTFTAESSDAEVAWYALPNGRTIPTGAPGQSLQLYTLYRRVLLVNSSLASKIQAALPYWPTSPGMVTTNLQTLQGACDISAYLESANGQMAAQAIMLPTTLATLSQRENRYGHFGRFGGTVLTPFAGPTPGPMSPRFGEDVILTDVLAFDVQVFDPGAPLMKAANGDVLEPSDPGYSIPASPVGMGAFVDLGWAARGGFAIPSASWFGASQLSRLSTQWPTAAIYDTWSSAVDVELGGLASNGLDDPDYTTGVMNGIVDDAGETAATPPYPHPLRGVRVKIRVYEPDSRQVRQVSVVQDFLPE